MVVQEEVMADLIDPITHEPTTHPVEVATVEPRQRERSRAVMAGAGGVSESMAAAGVIVLAILALAGTLPALLIPIAVIAGGVALLLEGGAVASRMSRLMIERSVDRTGTTEVEGGIAAEALAGAAGIALGVLALVGIAPNVLSSVAIIVFGGGMLFGSGARAKLSSMRHQAMSPTVEETVSISAGGEVLVGIGAIVLGILSLLGFAPMTLVLIALLAIGGALLLSGGAIGARMLGFARA
jgi:hypothetical protein